MKSRARNSLLPGIVLFIGLILPNYAFGAAPSITSLTPNSGAVGASITIAGKNFGTSQGSSTVTFNGVAATTITSWSSSSIKANVPVNATTGNVVVTVSGTASNGVAFTVLPAPSISSLSPTSGAIGSGVTISGSNFGATQGSATFNGVSASISSWTSTSITVTVPSTASTGNVIVLASGVSSNGVLYTVIPQITSISPGWGTAGSAQTIHGTGFGSSQGSSTVTFNGTNASTITSWSSTAIALSVPNNATSGGVVVTVGGQASSGFQFVVGSVTNAVYHLHQEAGSQTASALLSTAGPDAPSTVYQSANLNGNSSGYAQIKTFSTLTGIPGILESPTTITFSLWMNETASVSGLYPDATLYVYLPPPINTWDQLCAVQGASALTTSWTKFTFTCNLSSGYAPLSSQPFLIYVSAAWTTGHSVRGNVQAQLSVEGTLNGNYDSTLTIPELLYPLITGLTPSSGSPNSPVTINGNGFGTTAGTVTFNGANASPTSWTVTSIAVSVPSAATSGPVVVTTPTQASNPYDFTVTPSVGGLSPSTGPIGTAVTITGTGFGTAQNGSVVTFNGVPAPITSWASTSITATVPPGATSGPVAVTVNGASSNSGTFTVGPTIASVIPNVGSPGTNVTISGMNFGATAGSVSFNGVQTTPTSWTSNQILVQVPANASTGPVMVTANGLPSNGVTFSISSGNISGVVTSASNGSPVTGATVSALVAKAVKASTTTASDGTYSLPNLASGTYDVIASAPNFGTTASRGNLVSSGTATVNIALPSPGTVAGNVTTTSSSPIANASVAILLSGDSVGSGATDSNGNYSIATIAPGTYTVQVSASGYQLGAQSGVVVTSGNTTTENFQLSSQRGITYTYDTIGRLIGAVDPQGTAVTYSYDAVGNIVSIGEYSASQVSIIGFTPQTGNAGTTVTISGTGFSTNPSQDQVSFNGSSATVTSATATQIIATVPSGATSGLISVTSPQGSANSPTSFTVTQ